MGSFRFGPRHHGEEDKFVKGTPEDDFLWGGRGADSIAGLAGDDLIIGRKGADVIGAGDGNDLVLAGRGDDSVGGGAGDDTLFGGDGDDFLWGEGGRDVLHGGRGADLFGLAEDRTAPAPGEYSNVVLDFDRGEGDRLWVGGTLAQALYLANGATAVAGGVTITDGVRVQLILGLDTADFSTDLLLLSV